jgi:large subunit ribosomal protein L10
VTKAKKCELKGGIVDGKLTSAVDMDAIADLPSKEVLISRMLGSMKSPISKFVIVLDQIAKQKGEAPEA